VPLKKPELSSFFKAGRAKSFLKRGLCALLMFEAALAGISFSSIRPQRNAFLDYHVRAAGALTRDYRLSGQMPSNDAIRSAFLDARTKVALDDLFDEDARRQYTELAGILCLDEDEQGRFLRFYVGKTINEELAEEFLFAPNEFDVLQERKSLVSDMLGVSSSLIDDCVRTRNRSVIDQYLFQSDYMANLDLSLLYGDNIGKLQGRVLGEFHLHRFDKPSAEDRKANWYVFVRDPYSLYRTQDGSEQKLY